MADFAKIFSPTLFLILSPGAHIDLKPIGRAYIYLYISQPRRKTKHNTISQKAGAAGSLETAFLNQATMSVYSQISTSEDSVTDFAIAVKDSSD